MSLHTTTILAGRPPVKLSAPAPTSKPTSKTAAPEPPSTPPSDSVTLSAGKSTNPWWKRVGLRTLKNVALGTLPALATCAAVAVGGPTVAGLTLAGGIVAGGLVAAKLLTGEVGLRDAFGVGGYLGLMSGAAGMMGPVGVGLMAGGALARQAVGELTYLADYGEIARPPER